ncbi:MULTISPECIES: hypothetical protein [unclassified Ruegeria]|uniref:DUF7742 family protein n=1 Tax=unclassified Ruegeria TaxID=2625375 RepID=UPI001487A43D|nr:MULTISPECIES: hypothetical protein [unclassified Ruegeria]NOD34206.1 hypothetical protein [Ruegeria sp. HKCCD7296]NOD46606.1 hypothetical protein [Ruegeria sp. HKCCD5849]NOD50094.1 hypothetical protein [Ruegeria sp. HKCCD5851]NOD66929.1 hypothetical protein [Ruegeria sp. HKCCD7303]NOE32517.1 hypothetical protein [Ruegeria sp. HKCCD7318]
MRPVLHGDVSAAARALLTVPQAERTRLCVRMIHEAELADEHLKNTGRLHPIHGNGSLMAVARNRALADEPGFDNLQYCQCFETVLHHLSRFLITRQRS